jgi:hypothetical protein
MPEAATVDIEPNALRQALDGNAGEWDTKFQIVGGIVQRVAVSHVHGPDSPPL